MTPPLRFKINTDAFSDFWHYEDGKMLLLKLGEIPIIEKAYEKVPLLFQKDDVADDVIADCFIGSPFPQALQQLTNYAIGKTSLHSAPESVRVLIQEMSIIPKWVDPTLLSLGREFCNRSGKSGLIVLRNYSLMLGYQSAAINKPLIATGALHSGAVKRIADTTNFWFAVTGENALQQGNDGFIYCLRTRLVHAYSRGMIKQKLDWHLDEQAEPLNHWDMVATYLGFSLVYMEGLKKLGFIISEQESKAVYHLWKYIGYLIGIPAEIMPNDDLNAIENLYLWSKTQPEADADSLLLAHALYEEPLHTKWPPKLYQKRFIQKVNLAFNYHLIGKRSCAVLKLPVSNYTRLLQIMIQINSVNEKIAAKSDFYRKWQIRRGRAEQQIIRNHVNT
ncbi:MAG TPA: oxygenase MpaB family protein [Flavobacterium sp.]|jgi:hypothetical protein